jgi:rhodanese-related sulfurtransferase
MVYAALGIAVVALLLALSARSTAAGIRQAVEEAKADARRRAENALGEAQQETAQLRRMLARVAAGAKLSPAMIEEGRLWHDLPAPEGVRMHAAGGVRVVDVRTPQETSMGIIPGAQLIPVDELEKRLKELPKDGRKTILYCAGGGRSASACEFLSAQGYEELYNLEGGFQSWTGPTAKPK